MDRKEADILLRKFYDGETTLAEEEALRHYFSSGGNISPEFNAENELFRVFAGAGEDTLSEEELGSMIDVMNEIPETPDIFPFRRKTLFRVIAVAASFLMLLAVYTGYRYSRDSRQIALLTDTYKDNPALAYDETKRVLLYVSSQFNRGTAGLAKISTLNEPAGQLNQLRALDEGLDKLRFLNKLESQPGER